MTNAAGAIPPHFCYHPLDLVFAQKSWPFALEHRDAIAANFSAMQRDRPAIWNGRVLLMHEHTLKDGVLRGAYLETDFASLNAWRAWGWPEAGVRNCFGASVLIAADGAVLLGVMGPATANDGQAYFPCGTPDRDDLIDGRVDLEASAARELKEETGIDAHALDNAPGWIALFVPGEIVMLKIRRARDDAQTLRRRILDHLARERDPELSDVAIVRGPADVDGSMPEFVTAFLTHLWSDADLLRA